MRDVRYNIRITFRFFPSSRSDCSSFLGGLRGNEGGGTRSVCDGKENSLENCVFSRGEKRTRRAIVGIFLIEKKKRNRRRRKKGIKGQVGMLDAFSRGRRRQFRFRRFNFSLAACFGN